MTLYMHDIFFLFLRVCVFFFLYRGEGRCGQIWKCWSAIGNDFPCFPKRRFDRLLVARFFTIFPVVRWRFLMYTSTGI